MEGLTEWLIQISGAIEAENEGDPEVSTLHLNEAVNAFEKIKSGQQLAVRGERWENWYAGETKMNLKRMEEITQDVLRASKNRELDQSR
jgi:hypothetical protein